MKFAYRMLSVLFTAGLIFSGWQPALAQSAQPQTVNGWFTIVWGDVRSNGSGTSSYLLTDDTGQTLALAMDERLAAPLGGVLALDRHRIRVAGIRQTSAAALGSMPTLQVDSVSLADSAAGATAQDVSAQAVTGSHPFISILCKFKDVGTEPKTLSYFQNMYSNVYPGLDSYWQEVSYLTANIAGSGAVGWYTLPQNHDYYAPGGVWNFGRAAADCTAAADAVVDFSSYTGINLMFNDTLDSGNYAWGGTQCMILDNVNKCWPMTWEPTWGYSSITVIAHEMGHAFGLPHSSGQYGQTYDNHWDVMSDGWSDCANATDAIYGCLGQQTISYHKDKLGWIPTNKKFTVTGNATITLEELALPQTGNYLMAQIPIGGSTTHFYTVEVRRKVGYDVKLPGQGVIIHDVDLTRLCPANVVDTNSDKNQNTGDASAIWTVGERFSDAANGIYVKVVSASLTGFTVSIQIPVAFTSLAGQDGWMLESSENSNVGGTFKNTTTLAVGDNVLNRQYRSVLHFDTSSLPDNAVVTGATLRILKQALTGTNPFTTHGKLLGDIARPFLGASDVLQASDFQAAASAKAVFTFNASPTGGWYVANMSSAGAPYINRTASTQLRLRFALDDNNDLGADFMSFYSGEAAAGNQPRLIVKYYVP